jgi:hypothetical protein
VSGNGANNTAAASGSGNGTSGAASQTSLAAGQVIATTITSLVPGPSGTQTNVFTFTFTVGLNGTADGLNNNGTLTNGTVDGNGTISNETLPWNDTLSYLPFSPKLDAAYGLGGALLILSGIPVATLGGKNRWSALAIVSGYTVAFFCLVIILSFG